MSKFRPLLAEKADPANLQYPVYGSPKYDGFRCLIDGMGNPVSRNLKPIANAYVFGKLKEMGLPRFDGELLTYTNEKVDDFNTVQSKLASRSGMPDFKYMVFDYYATPMAEYLDRLQWLNTWIGDRPHLDRIVAVPQTRMSDEEKLLEYEAKCLAEGWEGVMVRSHTGPYKYGRSTVREGILLKIKRFFDSEAIVLEAHELMHNANEAVENVLGYTERSSHKDGFIGKNMLGKFTVQWDDVTFDVGTGFNEAQRIQYWNEADRMVGRKLTFKYQSITPAGKPRFPVFLGFRHD